jgi:hypothetical protein
MEDLIPTLLVHFHRQNVWHDSANHSGKGQCEPRLRKMVALLFGKELRQRASKVRFSCLLTIQVHENLWLRMRKELRRTTLFPGAWDR